jgi:hypothetical protein
MKQEIRAGLPGQRNSHPDAQWFGDASLGLFLQNSPPMNLHFALISLLTTGLLMAEPSVRDDAAWLRAQGSLVFHDTFDREETGNGSIGNGWHDLILVTEGDEMRLSLDGCLLVRHRSAGFAHPVKRWSSFLVPGTAWIEDVGIFKVN